MFTRSSKIIISWGCC